VENFFVGKRFSSMDNKSPFGSLKIDGKYFRKTLNGESYNK